MCGPKYVLLVAKHHPWTDTPVALRFSSCPVEDVANGIERDELLVLESDGKTDNKIKWMVLMSTDHAAPHIISCATIAHVV